MKRPNLIEPGMKYYMDYSLENSHKYKKKMFNMIFNIGLFLVFTLSISWFLYYSYKNKPSDEEREKQRRIKTQQIIEKVRSLNNRFSTPNSNVFREKIHTLNTKSYDEMTIDEKLVNDPHIITNLPPLKFM